jgi:hypothetical protein
MNLDMQRRNATLADVAELLKEQHTRKHDFVVSAQLITSVDGVIVVRGAEQELTDEGVTSVDGRYRPTAIFDEGLADKLGIPLAYLRKLRAERPDLYDANVNGWLHGRSAVVLNPRRDAEGVYRWDDGTAAERGEQRFRREPVPPDPRSFLLRTFKDDETGLGIARAFLSNGYKVIDHLDAIAAALEAVRDAGVEATVQSVDLSERRLSVRVAMPSVRALAPVLLAGYRNPFADPGVERAANHGWDVERARAAAQAEGLGFGDGEEPVVFSGCEITNSETGGGALMVTPRLIVQVCRNGLKITKDAMRAVHLGGKLEDGLIRWSDETQQRSLELVKAKMRDVIRTVADTDYVTAKIAEVEELAGVRVKHAGVLLESVGKQLAYDQDTIDGVLGFFVRGGQMTAGGVLNAVTGYAQTVADPDRAQEIEASGLRALALAAVR